MPLVPIVLSCQLAPATRWISLAVSRVPTSPTTSSTTPFGSVNSMIEPDSISRCAEATNRPSAAHIMSLLWLRSLSSASPCTGSGADRERGSTFERWLRCQDDNTDFETESGTGAVPVTNCSHAAIVRRSS